MWFSRHLWLNNYLLDEVPDGNMAELRAGSVDLATHTVCAFVSPGWLLFQVKLEETAQRQKRDIFFDAYQGKRTPF